MRNMRNIGTATDIGTVQVPELEVHVVGHGQWPEAGSVAGAEIAVDIILRQAGIGQRADRAFGVQLRDGLVLRQPGRVLISPGNIGCSLDAHDPSQASRMAAWARLLSTSMRWLWKSSV